jgi:epoxyqueuosine reductase
VGEDYAPMLADALEAIAEDSAAKGERLAAMAASEARGERPGAYEAQRRWIGALRPAADADT